MRFKKLLFNVAVVAVSGFNVYLVNGVIEQKKYMSLLDLENITAAQELTKGDVGGSYKGVPKESWVKEDFTNEWVYINGQKVKASGTRVYLQVDCIGEEFSNCQPSFGHTYSVIY